MNVKSLEASFRDTVDDLKIPGLWSPAEFLRYLNEAVNDACERARLLEDFETPEITRITIRAGKASYPLDPRIIDVRSAKLDLQNAPLVARVPDDLDRDYPQWRTQVGRPWAYVDNTNTITLVDIPVADDVLRLRVVRRPLQELTKDGDCPEIPPHLHEQLLQGVMARAYMKRDADTFNPQKAAEHEVLFTRCFGAKRTANVARKHREKRRGVVRSIWRRF